MAIVGALGCSDRPGGTPIVSLTDCEALGGRAVLDTSDAGTSSSCEPSILLGYLDPDEVGTSGGLCCE